MPPWPTMVSKDLGRAKTETFDLILLDVMMPKMDGLKTCEELRRNGFRRPFCSSP
ncbi:MAG: hypothetical protein CM1200mP36_10580 [Gammaproteobacteria bacterium]|nr:MAG: hypothetical protein CM1200mP36_10580 [Gammaproteobacteria bacterium]